MQLLLPPPDPMTAPPRLRRLPSSPPRRTRRWIPWVASALVHTVLFAGLWEYSRPLGERGTGSSATSDADRPDSFSTATWEPPEETTTAEDDDTPRPEEADPVFELAAEPVEVTGRDERPIADAPVPSEAEMTLPTTPSEVPAREPDPFPAFGPGHPIPRIAKATVAPAPTPKPPPALAAVTRAPAPPTPPPPAPARGGGGEGLRPPVADPANPQPAWPADALARGERGRVQLKIRVTADGQVTWVTVAASSGSASLDAAAVAAASRWRFRPATRGGVPIDAWVLRGVTFE